MSGVAEKYKFVLTGRWIPEKSEAGQAYTSFKYWVTSDLGLGFDYRPLVDKVSLTATYRLVSEDSKGWMPAVHGWGVEWRWRGWRVGSLGSQTFGGKGNDSICCST